MNISKNNKTLNKEELADFITFYKSGRYYLKELCEMFCITYYQAQKEIKAYEERKKKHSSKKGEQYD